MAVLIKNFGNDMECNTLAEFKKALTEKYVGRNVSIVSTLPSGIKTSVFVDVQEDGSLIESYRGDIIAYYEFSEKFNLN
ncbi:MAG: hypothetical protein COB35_12660 [Gammaproteobacteria bacterium]|nr:MAG: hypothetical protein COB35_12660 [Gammaproteobacteria bacterium]